MSRLIFPLENSPFFFRFKWNLKRMDFKNPNLLKWNSMNIQFLRQASGFLIGLFNTNLIIFEIAP